MGKKIGIIVSLSYEMDTIKKLMENSEVKMISGNAFYIGEIAGHDVVLAQCGKGKVSASIVTQTMILIYHPDIIVNTGLAIAFSDKLSVGDIVIAEKTVEWDIDLIEIGIPRGFITAMDKIEMYADGKIVSDMEKAIGDKTKIHKGLVVSGDRFATDPVQKKIVFDSFPESLCFDKDGAAIGHVCEQNYIPFGVFRYISHNTDNISEADFAEFSEKTGERTAEILLNFLKNE